MEQSAIASLNTQIKYPCPECKGCVIFNEEGEAGCNGCGRVYKLEIFINISPQGTHKPYNIKDKKEC